jgi:hypothetical protein
MKTRDTGSSRIEVDVDFDSGSRIEPSMGAEILIFLANRDIIEASVGEFTK